MISRKATKLGVMIVGLVLGFNAQAKAKRYLVQFKSPAAFTATTQEIAAFNRGLNVDSVSGSQVKLFNTSAKVTNTLNHVQMLVIESSDALAIASLRTRPEIALIEEEVMHPAPQPLSTRGVTADGSVSAPPAVMAQPWGIGAVKAPAAWATTKGAGARVLVLDTGIDKSHEAVMGNLEAVQNFTGGNSSDVTDTVGHGTHVSGTVLADGNHGLVGVAPEAKLLMGKVCSDLGCSSVAITSGIDWAVQQKVDVVNMSLGGAFMTSAEGAALQRAEAAGVTVVCASGNDGKPKVSFPGAAPTALAVGAIDVNLVKADFSNWGPELDIVGPGVDVMSSVPVGTGRGGSAQINLGGKGLAEVASTQFVGSPIASPAENDLVFVGLGKSADFAGVKLSGKLALIQRGEIPFKEKVMNAIAAGAVGVVIYNNAPGLIQGAVTDDGTEVAIPAVMIEQSLGEAAKAALAAGQGARALIAVIRTDYAAFAGTSMASPHVAGVAALVRAANKSLSPAQVRSILMTTATPMTPNDQNQLGSGLVNAEAAVAKARSTFVPQYQIAN